MRNGLGMTAAQPGRRIRVSQNAISQAEQALLESRQPSLYTTDGFS
jgi:hypothetical protein